VGRTLVLQIRHQLQNRELQEMLAERGVNVDHSTIYRWVQRYAPEMEKRLRWYWRNPSDLCPWHMDETYVKVNGRWAYLYRAVDSRGRTVDFMALLQIVGGDKLIIPFC
jgi:IS6 family transposase